MEHTTTTTTTATTTTNNKKKPSSVDAAAAAARQQVVDIVLLEDGNDNTLEKEVAKGATKGSAQLLQDTTGSAKVALSKTSQESTLTRHQERGHEKGAANFAAATEEQKLAAAAAAAAANSSTGKTADLSNDKKMAASDLRRSFSAIPSLRRSDPGQARHSHSRPGAVSLVPGSSQVLQAGRLTLTPSTSLTLNNNNDTTTSRAVSRQDLGYHQDNDEEQAVRQAVPRSNTLGLVEARRVSMREAPVANAEPVFAHGDNNNGDQERKGGTREVVLRQTTKIILLILVVCGIVLAVVLVLAGPGKNDNDTSSSASAEPGNISTVPTAAPTLMYGTLLGLPEAKVVQILNDPSSPQAKAYSWLQKDPNVETLVPWKATQRYALASLYFATQGEQWSLNEHWLAYDLDECTDWFFRVPIESENQWAYRRRRLRTRILQDTANNSSQTNNSSACDMDGHYTTLVLSSNNLDGILPPEIGILTKLRLLDLSANDALQGDLPSEIGLLTDLQRLSADRNAHWSIPSELGMLPKIETIYLEHNPFLGSIPTELGLATALRSLSLQRSGLTGYLPTELYQLTKLQELHVQNILGLTGGTLEGIGALTDLESFLAHDVPFNSTIPSEVGLLTNLHSFNLWNTNIYGSLPAEYWQMTNMVNMDIDDNFLSGTFPEELGKFSHLESVWMNGNQFNSTFPTLVWSNLKNLTYLKMNGNHLSGTIPTEVGLLTSINQIWFADMGLTGTIPSEIGSMQALEGIFFHLTELEGTIPAELENLEYLELITLSDTLSQEPFRKRFARLSKTWNYLVWWYWAFKNRSVQRWRSKTLLVIRPTFVAAIASHANYGLLK